MALLGNKTEENEDRTYDANVICTNCQEEFADLEIPIGTTINDYCKTQKCGNCGCIDLSGGTE